MKILYLSSVQIPSEKASGLAIARQCEAFVSSGHNVTLVVPNRTSAELSSFTDAYDINSTFQIKYLNARGIYFWGKPGFVFMMLRDAIKSFWYFWTQKKNYDLIYTRDHRLLLMFVLFGFSSKCYVELHTKHIDLFTDYIVKKVKKVIVISHGLKTLYERISDRQDIQVEPSGVDLKQFENLPPVTTLRKKLNLPLDATVVGYIGKYTTMGECKGVDELIEAFAGIWESVSGPYLFIVGLEPDEMNILHEKCLSLGIPPSRFCLRSLNQKKFAEYVACTDVAIANYPDTEHYREYMSPTKLFAYLAGRKIVIASDLMSIRLVAGESVVYVEPGNIEDLKNTILSVFLHEDQYVSLYKKIDINQYSWRHRAERILATHRLN